MKILNYGSINIDYVYRVSHIVVPGETITGNSLDVFQGGKGANQSVAIARAGGSVMHAGKVGANSEWLLEKLNNAGVDTTLVSVTADPTGHAIIQVDDNGQNSIVLFPGTNRQIADADIQCVFENVSDCGILLLQNEISGMNRIIRTARERGMRVCFNPAPFDASVKGYPLDMVDIFVVNEVEGAGMSGEREPLRILGALSEKFPKASVLLTLGPDGAMYAANGKIMKVPAVDAEVLDTTAAGDTFIGYFLTLLAEGEPEKYCLDMASRAAAICVSRRGAADSIPLRTEIIS